MGQTWVGVSRASLTDLKCAVLHTAACERNSQACHQPQQGSVSICSPYWRTRRVHRPQDALPHQLPLWGCLFFMCEQPAPGLWVLLRGIQRKKTHCTHPVPICADPLRPWLQEPGSQDLGTFESRICGFKVCPGKNVLCPAARMRRLRRHWTSAAGDTGTHTWVLHPGPAATVCCTSMFIHYPTSPHSRLRCDSPDPLVCVSAATFCDVGRPGRLRR